MEQPNGATYDCVFITNEEKEVINLFRANEMSIKEYMEYREDYIERLLEIMQSMSDRLEEIQHQSQFSKQTMNHILLDKPSKIEEIKKPL